MRIVFVHTPMAAFPVAERREFWMNFDIRYHAAHPGLRHMKNVLWELPHWMLWLAGVLDNHGYRDLDTLEFYTSECALEGIDFDGVRRSVEQHPGDVYLFSPMTPNLFFAYQIAEVIKSLNPDAVTVFGGVVATPLHKTVARHPAVDYVVFDRGEYALPRLLQAVEGRLALEDVGNLSYERDDGSLYTSPLVHPYMPVEDIPFPRVDLFPPSVGEDIRYLRQVYGLGCPYRCSFCTIQTIGRKAQYFPIERVLAEIRAYRAHYGQHHNIYFGDETFTVNPERTVALCNALEAEGDIFYDCQTRLNCVHNDDVLRALKRSGCRWLEIGIETFSQESQNLFKQKVKLHEIRETLRRVADHGIPVCSFMVNGFPNQTTDDIRRSIEFACELISGGFLQASYLFGLVPYPGSTMYENPGAFGMTLHHHDYRYYHEEMMPVFDSKYAKSEDAYRCFLQGLLDLAQAMSGPGRLCGSPLPARDDRQHYGAFWASSHV